MNGVKDFLTSRLQAMVDYIIVVSTPEAEPSNSSASASLSAHDRIRVASALRQRGATLPALYREAIPLLPHLVDIPKHLAVITSLVVRYSRVRGTGAETPSEVEQGHLGSFCAQCIAIEEQALHRVSQLAASPRRRSTSQTNEEVPTIASPVTAVPPVANREPTTSSSSTKRRPRKLHRPSTAPTLPRSREPSVGPETPATPESEGLTLPSQQTIGSRSAVSPAQRPPFSHHPRSNSTDCALLTKIASQVSKPTRYAQ